MVVKKGRKAGEVEGGFHCLIATVYAEVMSEMFRMTQEGSVRDVRT